MLTPTGAGYDHLRMKQMYATAPGTTPAASDGMVANEELAALGRLVERLRGLPLEDPVRMRGEEIAAGFARESRNKRRKARRKARSEADALLTAATATGASDRREDAVLEPRRGTVGTYLKPRHCYVCKSPYRRADAFYHRLCPACASDNARRRTLRTDLSGRRVLLTGGRVKIGFQLALMMLRDGAQVLVTSRFPHDALRRFHAVPGSGEWIDRLTVVAIDLRDPRQVLGLCDRLRADGDPLDILVNNAAQTIRRPPESYALLASGEGGERPAGVLTAPGYAPAAVTAGRSAPLGLVLAGADEAGLLPDLSAANSWSARIGELDPAELLGCSSSTPSPRRCCATGCFRCCSPPRDRAATS